MNFNSLGGAFGCALTFACRHIEKSDFGVSARTTQEFATPDAGAHPKRPCFTDNAKKKELRNYDITDSIFALYGISKQVKV